MMLATIAITLLTLCAICDGTEFTLRFIKNAQNRGAVCNDGSPSGFYFSPGSGTGLNVWLIHQEGGYACWTEAGCSARARSSPQLTSSKTWSNTMSSSGNILDSNPAVSPTFYNANKVYMNYCTSDYWAGTRAPNGTNGIDAWYFTGHNVTKAVMEDLVSDFGLNSTKSEVLFTGCSAGGKGVFVNGDWARSYLPFTPAKFLAFADEGWSADLPLTTGAYWYQFLYGTPVWHSLVNPNCNSAHPDHAFLCYFGSIAIPYFNTPTLVTAEQYDIVQFGEDCSCTFNKQNPTMMAWMEELRSAFVSSFRVLRSPHSLYSPACATHCISLTNAFNSIKINGITIAQYLDKFWQNGGNIPSLIDDCPQFNCSVGCPA